MTGYASIEYAVESMKAGAADFITKPFDFDHVLMVINRVFETRDLRLLAEEREFYKDLSNSDGLTKISNYRHFNQVLQMEIDRQQRYNRPLTLLIIDIDDFKQYNDIHGHLFGDMVLVQVAHLLTMQIRGCDFVARYGGEEFTVILPEVTEKEALAVGRRIMRCIGEYEFQSAEHIAIGTLSVTIGIASFPKDARKKKKLIDKADQALYIGKRAGKNCLCVYGQEKKIIR
jgi:diguanylate cyclase (GGDEF)-like protein